MQGIHHLRISYNIPKFVFTFSWVLKSSQKKLETTLMLMQNIWVEEGVLCEMCQQDMSWIAGLLSLLAILIRIIKGYGSVVLIVISIFLRRLKEELTRQTYTVESLVPLPRPSRPLPGILPQKNNPPTLKFRNGSINTRHKEVVDKE